MAGDVTIGVDNNSVHAPKRSNYGHLSEVCDSLCCTKDAPVNQPTDTHVLNNARKEYNVNGRKVYRSVNKTWYKSFPWVTLCTSRNKLFCHVCRAQSEKSTLTMSHNADKDFIQSGFQNWKKAVEKLSEHEKSLCHREALMKKTSEKQIPMAKMFSSNLAADQAKHRNCF